MSRSSIPRSVATGIVVMAAAALLAAGPAATGTAAAAAATGECRPLPAGHLRTPAVTSGGAFSDARDTALAGLVATRGACRVRLHHVVDLGDQEAAAYYTAIIRDLDDVLWRAGY